MLPTYSFSDIKGIIRAFDVAELALLTELIQEEISCYPGYESRAILRLIALQQKSVSRNELQLDYFLAYN